MTTHPHDGFQLARCRNEGVAASVAEKILFLDGDCLIPPDHLAQFARRLKPGLVLAGFCVWLDKATSERVTIDAVRRGDYLNWAPASEFKPYLNKRGREFYGLLLSDTSGREEWDRVELYSYPLFICTRPEMLLKAKAKT